MQTPMTALSLSLLYAVSAFISPLALAQERVSMATEDGGIVYADVYGDGDVGVVLAHGGRFNKESWAKQAHVLAEAGFRVIAIDFRGYGKSSGPRESDPYSAPLHLDVLAAVRYLREDGARAVSVVGGSMGGGAAGDASIHSKPGEIDRVVFLGSTASWQNGPLEEVKGRKLFVVTRDDVDGSGNPRLDLIRHQYEQVSEPKRLIVLDGSAHAQFIFETEQGESLLAEIVDFLSAP